MIRALFALALTLAVAGPAAAQVFDRYGNPIPVPPGGLFDSYGRPISPPPGGYFDERGRHLPGYRAERPRPGAPFAEELRGVFGGPQGGGERCNIILFEDEGFRGRQVQVLGGEPDLRRWGFNDRMSSFVILSGGWAFFDDVGFRGQYPQVLGPGEYPSARQFGIGNDRISSLRCVG